MSVVVVGSVNMDVVARVPRIPGPGETVLATGVARGGGGKGANQAVAAARAGGAATAFVGSVGDDPDGRALRAALQADDIDVSGVEVVTDPTGTALISVSDDGENAIVVVPGANGSARILSARQRELVATADVVVAQLEIPLALVLDAAAARRGGALFVLNGSPAEAIEEPETTGRILSAIDVLVVNEHELRRIAAAVAPDVGRTDLAGALDALAARVPAVVATLGAHGALVAVGSARRTVEAFSADVVDTTGAGDTFCGVLCARLAGQEIPLGIDTLAAAARAGAAAAAISVGRAGAQGAVPTVGELERRIGVRS